LPELHGTTSVPNLRKEIKSKDEHRPAKEKK